MANLFDFRSASRILRQPAVFRRPSDEQGGIDDVLLAGTEPAFNGSPDRTPGASRPKHPLGGWPKRLVDILVALAALLLALPVITIVAILIRITTGGPAFFSHQRIGYAGKPFPCYKFRTMVLDADKALAEHLARDPEAALEWSTTRKLRSDPRVTRLGHVLRKSSLDELPQLFNILRGEMSCVGPRPVVREELDLYGDAASAYLSTRPGLTGLWQVTGRSSADFLRRVSLDSQYVRDWSLMTDLLILAKTSLAVMRLDEVY